MRRPACRAGEAGSSPARRANQHQGKARARRAPASDAGGRGAEPRTLTNSARTDVGVSTGVRLGFINPERQITVDGRVRTPGRRPVQFRCLVAQWRSARIRTGRHGSSILSETANHRQGRLAGGPAASFERWSHVRVWGSTPQPSANWKANRSGDRRRLESARHRLRCGNRALSLPPDHG